MFSTFTFIAHSPSDDLSVMVFPYYKTFLWSFEDKCWFDIVKIAVEITRILCITITFRNKTTNKKKIKTPFRFVNINLHVFIYVFFHLILLIGEDTWKNSWKKDAAMHMSSSPNMNIYKRVVLVTIIKNIMCKHLEDRFYHTEGAMKLM